MNLVFTKAAVAGLLFFAVSPAFFGQRVKTVASQTAAGLLFTQGFDVMMSGKSGKVILNWN